MFFQSSVITTAALAGLSTVALAANNLNFVYSQGDFSTISGPGSSNQHGHNEGFVLTAEDGTELWSTKTINDHSVCLHTKGGKTFGLTSSCWEGTYHFHCQSDMAGDPQSCYATDPDNIQWDGAHDDNTVFTGIAISMHDWCGGPIYAGPGNCSPDDTFEITD